MSRRSKITYTIRNSFPFILLILSLFIISGCRKARMAVPSDLLVNAPEMKCEGRQSFSFNEDFTFGPYEVKDVHRGWTESEGWGTSITEKSSLNSMKSKQEFEFTIVRSGFEIWDARCTTAANVKKVDVENFLGGTLEADVVRGLSFFCYFRSREDTKLIWKLAMTQSTDEDVMSGVLKNEGFSLFIRGTHRLAGSSIPLSDPTGYEIKRGRNLVGAVEVINDGAVWILPSVSRELRAAISTASAALLLFKDISEQ